MAVTYPVTQVNEVGPNARSVQYIVQIPAGGIGTDGAFMGPVDFIPGGQFGIHVSSAPSAGVALLMDVYGTFDGPSITPSGRNWFIARGDTPPTSAADSGLNKYLAAVTRGGMIEVRGPARSYRFRVSSNAVAMTAPITLTVLAVKPNR